MTSLSAEEILRWTGAARSSAALFNRSTTAKLELTGPDATQFLHNISTNDIKSLPLGGGCEAYLCDARAKALFQLRVYHIQQSDGAHALWVETTPERGQALLQYLDRFLISERVEMNDVTEIYSQYHLAGPRAKETLETLLGEKLPDLLEFQHLVRPVSQGDFRCQIRRSDLLGVPGYDLVCPKGTSAPWQSLQGVLIPSDTNYPVQEAAFEQLRIEAVTPVYGIDIDENRFVMEIAQAPRAISYTKGCFPGQEPIVMARDRAGRVNRTQMGLKVLEGPPLPPGTLLTVDGTDAALVTSSVPHSSHGVPFALAYVHWKFATPGTKITTTAGNTTAEVVS